ncbi:hypothetical protein HY495_00695 [Candidatus Woesearchaeota archaeon]|nr:hypothetical protein [Candidatus Woesearchaeota archaeon]
MNTKWGWWSLCSLLIAIAVFFLLIAFGVVVTVAFGSVTIFLLLSIFLGVAAIVKRNTESKTSFVMSIVSLIFSFLLLLFEIFIIPNLKAG